MLQEKLLVDTTLKNMFRLDSTANTYRSAGVSEVYPKLPHGPNDCHQTLNGVAVDHGLVLETLLRAVASLVDYLHLLHDRRLPALAGAEQQQLDLPAGLLAVQRELSVDLPAALGGLLLEAGHGAPHHCRLCSLILGNNHSRQPPLGRGSHSPTLSRTSLNHSLCRFVSTAAKELHVTNLIFTKLYYL